MTREDAENAGLRPCKRCKPNQASLVEHYGYNVTKACRFIEESEKVPSLEELANHVGISMFHFHRMFKTITGLTPREYALAHCAKRIRNKLGHSETVTEAIYDAGYKSNRRFYETSNEPLGMTPSNYRAGGAGKYVSP